MRKHLFAAVVVALLFSVPTLGALVITVGDNPLLENTAGQTVDIYMTGGDGIDGVNFRAQIADGYPEVGGSSVDGPDFQGLDATSAGMIFSGESATQTFMFAQATEWNFSADPSATGSGLLATLTIDTTGHFVTDAVTSWALDLEGMVFGDTTAFTGPPLTNVPISITNGTIFLTAIPEPAIVVQLLGLAGAGTLGLWFRRRKSRTP